MRTFMTIAIITLSSGPALGQSVSLPETRLAQPAAGEADFEAHFDDCLVRYRTLYARSNMLPSERRRAIEHCRATAQSDTIRMEIASQLPERGDERE